jgi:hypothetical protein
MKIKQINIAKICVQFNPKSSLVYGNLFSSYNIIILKSEQLFDESNFYLLLL